MIKIKICAVLLCLLWLTACPAPEFNHVIINESNEDLNVEYEFFLPMVKHDYSDLTAPAKMTLAEYNGGEAEKKWRKLVAPNDYESEMTKEDAEESEDNQTGENQAREVGIYRLKLMPGEVVRVFRSAHINYDIKNVKRILIKGRKGKLEIEGTGFEQFNPPFKGGLFPQISDYRIVYR